MGFIYSIHNSRDLLSQASSHRERDILLTLDLDNRLRRLWRKFIGPIICAACCHKPPHIESLVIYAWKVSIFGSCPQYYDEGLLYWTIIFMACCHWLPHIESWKASRKPLFVLVWKFIILTPASSLRKGIYQPDPAFARLVVTYCLASRASWQSSLTAACLGCTFWSGFSPSDLWMGNSLIDPTPSFACLLATSCLKRRAEQPRSRMFL